jgi:hypothetical protein
MHDDQGSDRVQAPSQQHEQRKWLTPKKPMEISHLHLEGMKAGSHQGHAVHFISFLLCW